MQKSPAPERDPADAYELYDLQALFDLATLAQGAGMSLFAYETADGRGLHKAFDFMVPYVNPQTPWPYPKTNTPVRTDFIELLRRAAVAYDEPQYESTLEMYFATSLTDDLIQLEYPK